MNLALLITYLKIRGGEISVLQICVLRKMGGGGVIEFAVTKSQQFVAFLNNGLLDIRPKRLELEKLQKQSLLENYILTIFSVVEYMPWILHLVITRRQLLCFYFFKPVDRSMYIVFFLTIVQP